jgi:hypothetical protein
MVKWFRSFSEVPGVGYQGNPGLCPQLPEHAILVVNSMRSCNARLENLCGTLSVGAFNHIDI